MVLTLIVKSSVRSSCGKVIIYYNRVLAHSTLTQKRRDSLTLYKTHC